MRTDYPYEVRRIYQKARHVEASMTTTWQDLHQQQHFVPREYYEQALLKALGDAFLRNLRGAVVIHSRDLVEGREILARTVAQAEHEMLDLLYEAYQAGWYDGRSDQPIEVVK